MTVEVDVAGTLLGLERLERTFRSAVEFSLEAGVEAATKAARGTVLWRDRSGETRGSIRGEVSGSRGFVRAGGASKFLENGRGPVVAVNARALRFVINGQVLFRKSVKAAKPRPFMAEARNVGEAAAYFAAERMMGLAVR